MLIQHPLLSESYNPLLEIIFPFICKIWSCGKIPDQEEDSVNILISKYYWLVYFYIHANFKYVHKFDNFTVLFNVAVPDIYILKHI